MKRLDELLKQLEEAEKEYSEKCQKYGIEETSKRKKKEVDKTSEQHTLSESFILYIYNIFIYISDIINYSKGRKYNGKKTCERLRCCR